jgi:hypothetical protein
MSLFNESDEARDEAVRKYWATNGPRHKFNARVQYAKTFTVAGNTEGGPARVACISSNGIEFLYDIEFEKTHYRLCDVKESDLRAHNDNMQTQSGLASTSEFWRTYKRKFRDGERVTLMAASSGARAGVPLKYGSVQALHDTPHERHFATDFHYRIAYDDGTFDTYEAERNLQRIY